MNNQNLSNKNGILNQKRRARLIFKLKLNGMGIIIIAAFFFLSIVIINIKNEFGDEYTQRAIAQLINTGTESDMVLSPNRGAVLDRFKQSIAVSSTVYDVFLDVKLLIQRSTDEDGSIDNEIIDKTFSIINEIVGTPLDQLYSYMEKNPGTDEYIYGGYQHLIFQKQVKAKDAFALMDRKDEEIAANGRVMRDVYIEAISERNYQFGTLAAQVVGFTRGDAVWGLESSYNSSLSGTPGRIFKTYSTGSVVTDRIEAIEGNTLITTLDIQLQQFSEQLCVKYAEAYEAPNASVIIMNPNTGEVYTMAESPGFSLNDPMNYEFITDSRLKYDLSDENQEGIINKYYELWKNFNTYSTFEPGSIFKPITVAAALDEGVISRNSTYYCSGGKVVAGIPIGCHYAAGHGSQNLEEAIMNSCNVALMDIAALLGRDLFYKYQHDFSYGEKTGIDVSEEEHYDSIMHSLAGLNETELATGSFGQRFKCTPIQAITSFAAVINGGTLYQPHIVSQMTDERGNVVYEKEPKIVRKVISRETSDYLRTAMQRVVTQQGTGRRAEIPGYAIGGKTGTGEQGIRGNDDYSYTLSFIGYLPVDNPQYLVLALIDKVPEEVYDTKAPSAAPMIKEIFEYLIANKGIKPIDDSYVTTPNDKIQIGDYGDMPLNLAVSSINDAGLDFEIIGGSGTTIASQSPDANTLVPTGTTVFFTLKTDGDYGSLVPVPSLIGLEVSEATSLIEAAGFTPVVIYDSKNEEEPSTEEPSTARGGEISNAEPALSRQHVYKQMPGADISVIEGMEVKIRVR